MYVLAFLKKKKQRINSGYCKRRKKITNTGRTTRTKSLREEFEDRAKKKTHIKKQKKNKHDANTATIVIIVFLFSGLFAV